ncbi:MAG: dipeptidase [Bacillota bacterium]
MEIDKTARELHFSSLVVDAHCDTLTVLDRQERRLGQQSQRGHVDIPRLAQGGVNLQFFAVFISKEYRDNPLARALQVFDTFFAEMEGNSEAAGIVYSPQDIESIVSRNKVAALLTVEGGEALAGRIEVLRMFYRIGVRGLTLTWNGRNELGDGVSEAGTGGGLTRFGVSVVREMNRLGMLVDVSHLSEKGFWDVLKESDRPVIASHSNCRALHDHPRNLWDQQIKVLAAGGGVVGLCFYPPFLGSGQASLEMLLDHAVHLAGVAGVDYIGLGSDFDGIESVVPGINDVTCLPMLTEGLLRRGFSPGEVKKILGGNFLRVIKQVL